MTKQEFNSSFLGFLDASPTPFHATKNMLTMLQNAGFIALNESETWELKIGERYVLTRGDSSIIAFNHTLQSDFTIIAAHTDSPHLKIKPSPQIKSCGVSTLGVEPYGGLLLNSWFDRDLGVAGKVYFVDKNDQLKESLICTDRAVAVVSSLAIHLDKNANKDRTINPQTDLNVIFSSDQDLSFGQFLVEELGRVGTSDTKEILSFDLSLYDTQKASFIGAKDEFISSARVDNLASCYCALLTLCSAPKEKPFMMICSDHEEVGSSSVQGAGGSFFENTIRRITPNYESFVELTQSSLLISCDNAHALHPNFSHKHDANHAPLINQGVAIKINSNQRYASSAQTVAIFKKAALRTGTKTQTFMARSDMGCGSTIGPITATRLGIKTIDIGIPTFAMHSIRELCGSDDLFELYEMLLGFKL